MRIVLVRVKAYERIVWLVLTFGVFAMLVWLRFNQLGTNPGWYSDEGSDLDIARHLSQGHWQYFALGGTPLVAARVPLFHVLLALGFQLWGYEIYTARLIVALFSVATGLVLFVAVREMLGKWTALWSILLFGILPNIFLYSRIAFAYNVQGFFVVICWYALWKFYLVRARIWLLLAALSATASYMTALTGVPLVLCVVVIVLIATPRELIWVLPLLIAPGLFFLALLNATAAIALQQDLTLTFGRASDSLAAQFLNLISNYVLWFDWAFSVVLGVIGLFLISDRFLRWLTLLVFFSILFNVMRAFPGAGDLNLHRYLGILPFLALGGAQFLISASSFTRTQVTSDIRAWRAPHWLEWIQKNPVREFPGLILLALLLIVPLIWITGWDVFLVSPALIPRPTRLDPVLVTNPSDARLVTDWVNARTHPIDVVLASPTIAWMLDANKADFQQALAFEGLDSPNYGKGFPRERFLYDVSFENAKFVILDNLWRGWASRSIPELMEYTQVVETWPRVKSQGEFDIYQNPSR